jgi:hypothetical protein
MGSSVRFRPLARHAPSQQLVKLPKAKAARIFLPDPPKRKMADLREFSGLARHLQSLLHARRMVRRAVQGRRK